MNWIDEMLLQTISSQILITGKGMGLEILINKTIDLYTKTNGLIIILNATESEQRFFRNTTILGKLSGVSERKKIYKKPGVYAISNSKMLSDMLMGVIEVEKISAILILNAEKIRPDDTITFIIEVLRQKNRRCIVKAYTENVEFTTYSPITSLLRSLKLNKSLLFPRFHSAVDIPDLQLTEIKLHNPYQSIQIILREIIIQLISELKIEERKDVDYETVIGSNFRQIVSTMWNYKSKPRVKKLISDLFLFKRAVSLLFSLDFGFFYHFLRFIYDEEIKLKGNTWINSEKAHLLMEATEEIYKDADKIEDTIKLYLKNKEINKSNEIEINKRYENLRGQFISSFVAKTQEKFSDSEDESDDFEICYEENKNLENINDDEIIKYQNSEKINDDENSEKGSNDENKYHKKIVDTSDCLLTLKENCKFKNSKLRNLIKILAENHDKRVLLISSEPHNIELAKYIFGKKINYHFHKDLRFKKLNYDLAILLEPNLTTLRILERHSIEPYVMFYRHSLEEEKYLNEIRKEKYTFEKLIREKANVNLDFSIIHRDDVEILVDSRELRCSLPYYLYKAANITVSMLPEGDYVIGDICIERKNIFDFLHSLNGRLYNQFSMAIHKYKNVYLLLEFEKRMCIGDYIDKSGVNSVYTKFCLFIQHFKPRIIWSNSNIQSVDFLMHLKPTNHIKPKNIDPVLQEILLNIPGINLYNLRNIFDNFKSLRSLIMATREELSNIDNGDIIHDFFRKKFKDIK
ncbi:DNA repair endonuclease XPF [Dictyocoela muelleri]|nr:DNA repair endonuclease XPF [Dictyocoela muelleri]